MSAALYIVLEQDLKDVDTFVNGKALSRTVETLDQIARKLSVTPLMAFFSVDPQEAAAMVEDAGGDPTTMNLPEVQWFPARDGLASVQALREYVRQQPPSVTMTLALQMELSEFERVLQSAQQQGVKWHLSVDY